MSKQEIQGHSSTLKQESARLARRRKTRRALASLAALLALAQIPAAYARAPMASSPGRRGGVAVVSRDDQNIDAFISGFDGRVYTSTWQLGSDWSGINDRWTPIGGFFPAGAPVSAAARTPAILDVFITGNDGRVYTSWKVQGQNWSGSGNNWKSLGGIFPPGAPVTALARKPWVLDLFITGNDGRVYTSWWTEGAEWSGINNNWKSLGGFFPPGAPVTAIARTPDIIDLFITGNDGRVYTSWWTLGQEWSGVNNNWKPLGGFFPAGAPIAATARRPTILDLFITGNDGRVYTSWWNEGGDWSGINNNWKSLGGFFPNGNPVTALAQSPWRLDLFITGNDGRVYTSWWNDGAEWSGINNNWKPIGGFFPSCAAVTPLNRATGILDLFITGFDGRVYTSWKVGEGEWLGINNNWKSIGGIFPSCR